MADRIASFKIFEKGNGFRYPFLFACLSMLSSCQRQEVKSEKKSSPEQVIEQEDDVSHKIFIQLDSLQQISINGNYVPVDSLGSALRKARAAKESIDPSKLLWVLKVHPDTKMGLVTDLKAELKKLSTL